MSCRGLLRFLSLSLAAFALCTLSLTPLAAAHAGDMGPPPEPVWFAGPPLDLYADVYCVAYKEPTLEPVPTAYEVDAITVELPIVPPARRYLISPRRNI